MLSRKLIVNRFRKLGIIFNEFSDAESNEAIAIIFHYPEKPPEAIFGDTLFLYCSVFSALIFLFTSLTMEENISSLGFLKNFVYSQSTKLSF